jgi:hypothetical protein
MSFRRSYLTTKKKTGLVCALMTYSPSQSPENLGYSILSASYGHILNVLELQKE